MHAHLALAKQAVRQHGLVTIDQVRSAGFGRSSWQRLTTSGAWVEVAPRVYRSGAVAVFFAQRCLAACLSVGPDAMVSHRSSAHLLKFDNFGEDEIVHVTTDRDSRLAKRSGLIVHRTTTLIKGDRAWVGKVPVTAPVRTILDLAVICTEHELEDAVDSALRNRSLAIEQLERRRAAIRGRGAVLLDRVVDGLPNGGLHTRLEREFVLLSRAAGLSDPTGQVVLRAGSTFLARVDFIYPTMNLIVEVSGHRTHSTRHDLAANAKRHRGLVANGLRWIEFTSDEVFLQPHQVRDELRSLR